MHYPNGDATSYLVVVFEGSAVRGTPTPDGHELLELGYFTKTEIATLRVARWVPEILSDLFDQHRGMGFRRPTWRPSAI